MKALLSFLETRFHHLFPFKEQSCFQKLCQKRNWHSSSFISIQFATGLFCWQEWISFSYLLRIVARTGYLLLNVLTWILLFGCYLSFSWIEILWWCQNYFRQCSSCMITQQVLYQFTICRRELDETELDNREGNIGNTRISGTLGLE